MQKRGILFLLIFVVLLFGVFSIGVLAEHEEGHVDSVDAGVDSDIVDEVRQEEIIPDDEDEFGDAELQVEAGLTPDSVFYFIDEFFDNFGSDLENREEKIAEIKSMIEQGKIEEARTALERYSEHAETFEKEVSPDEKEDALRSSDAIKNAISNLESDIPEEERGDFVDDVIEREERISTAVEIASKIEELCISLSEIDPLEYSRVCRTEEDAPGWQKDLDNKLTKEQREEAKKFGEIMSQCFKTAGQDCKCQEIPFKDFADMCAVAAPLATACEIDGDESACEKMDNLEMPELPEHLQDVFDRLERDVGEERFDLHMPRECVKVEAKTPKDCAKIMIETNAPEECRQALLDSECEGERECRIICEKIMFELNAPEECVEAGVTDPKECSKLSFEARAPQECVDAGLTGENRDDPKKCQEIMKGLRGKEGEFEGQHGFGGNCREITDSNERLACYDGATSNVGERKEKFEGDKREYQRKFAEECSARQGRWECSGGEDCRCFVDEFRREENRDDFKEGEFNQGEFEQRGEEEFRDGEGFNQEGFEGPTVEEFDSSGSFESGGEESSVTNSGETSSESSGPPESSTDSTSSGGDAGITGGAIFDFSGNGFLDYFFR